MFLVLSLRCCLFCSTVQRYGDFLPIPRNFPNSSLTCSDNRPDLRQIMQMPSKPVAHKGHPCCDKIHIVAGTQKGQSLL